MPLERDLSAAPYHDDFDENKKFHQFLFKPDTAVQVRELNGLQSVLQNQIERMGNNIFKNGTITDGVNFIFHDDYSYVKLNDTEIGGKVAVPENFVGKFLKSENGLTAYVMDYADGFESTAPDLKTSYIRYTNSGNSTEEVSFSSGQVLTVYDGNNVISYFNIVSSGTGYSNDDVIVTTSVLLANVNSGQFNLGDTITDPVSGAAGVVTKVTDNTNNSPFMVLGGSIVTGANSANVVGTSTAFLSDFSNGDFITVFSNTTNYVSKKINVVSNNTFMNLASNASITVAGGQYANTVDKTVFIEYKPKQSDLASTVTTASKWTFNESASIVNSSNSAIAQIKEIYGVNAVGGLMTDSSGRIVTTYVTNSGEGYTKVPVSSVRSLTGSSAVIGAQNYFAQVTVSSLAEAAGSSYAFSVTEGTIYQKGYFVKVDPQTIIVSKYNNSPDGVAVGFKVDEVIINSNIDSDILDNVLGDNNGAPGADRLKLDAVLEVRNVANGEDTSFFNLVEWSEGFPYKQNDRTFYNILGNEIDNRTAEQSGNFVVDRFLVATTESDNEDESAQRFNIVVDPGLAYVAGKRVETTANYYIPTDKAIDTSISNDNRVSVNYDHYLRVKNVGGFFEFDRANTIDLYDTAKSFLSNTALVETGNTAPIGTKIGTAKIRNFTFEQGKPGSPEAIYRVYLFDIRMNAGKNFTAVKSIYSNSAVKGIADAVLEPTTNGLANVAVITGPKNNSLIFSGQFPSILSSNNINYQYRTIDTNEISNTGVITISLASTATKSFPYNGVLSDKEKAEIYIAPQTNLISNPSLSGTVAITATSPIVTGTGTNFSTELQVGQYISVNTAIKRVVSITNSTSLTVSSNVGVTATGQVGKYAWPANVPIELQFNPSFTVSAGGANNNVLTIDLGKTLQATTSANVTIGYNVQQRSSATPKTPKRSVFVKLQLSNNAAKTVGPWNLGVPDIFRLRNVYMGGSNVSQASTKVTDKFYIEHNQTPNFYGLGSLVKTSNSQLVLTDDTFLLVEFDCFIASPGFYNINSYVTGDKANRFIEDAKPLADLTNTVNTSEIPEVFGNDGSYYDLAACVDFRPYADATANISQTVSGATVNPSSTMSFTSSDRFFPLPGSVYISDVEYFQGRVDSVILDKSGSIKVIRGTKGKASSTNVPQNSMKLNDIEIGLYPSIPGMISKKTTDILNTGVASSGNTSRRIKQLAITSKFNNLDFMLQQPKNYTELEIGSIDRRVRDLEYYQALTLAQSSIKDKIIPSSLGSNINRFKYGFFVDNYDDETNSEIDSPEYMAKIENGFAQPMDAVYNMVHAGKSLTSTPYTEIKIISQEMATTGPKPVEPAPANTTPTSPPVVIVPPTQPTTPPNYRGALESAPRIRVSYYTVAYGFKGGVAWVGDGDKVSGAPSSRGSTPQHGGSLSEDNNGNDPVLIYGAPSQTFEIVCNGLKPNTTHRAYLQGRDISGWCSQLTSNALGVLKFTFTFNAASTGMQSYRVNKYWAGKITESFDVIMVKPNTGVNFNFNIKSADSSSSADGSIKS